MTEQLINSFKESAKDAELTVEELDDCVLSVSSNEDSDMPHVIVTFDNEDKKYVSCFMSLFNESDLNPIPEEGCPEFTEMLIERMELHNLLLEATVMTPLSSIGKIDNGYVLNGQLMANDSSEIIEEIKFLHRNYFFVLRLVKDFLSTKV